MELAALLSVDDLAKALRISTVTVRRYIWEGKINTIRVGRRILIEPQEVTRFLDTARKGNTAEVA